jgi:hypothetical protein
MAASVGLSCSDENKSRSIVARVRARVKIALAALAALALARLLDARGAKEPVPLVSAPKSSGTSARPPTPCPAASLPDNGVCVPAIGSAARLPSR